MELPIKYSKTHWHIRKKAREQYIKNQDGMCHYCKAPIHYKVAKDVLSKPVNKRLFPKGFFENPIHLHHSHDTDMTIGAVHAHCNAVLWQYHNE